MSWLCPKCANDGSCNDIFEDRCRHFVESDKARKERLTEEVQRLLNATPNDVAIDADTVLADICENADYQITGIANELMEIWKQSSDRRSIESLFYLLTGETYEGYLNRAIESSTSVSHHFIFRIYTDPDELPVRVTFIAPRGTSKEDILQTIHALQPGFTEGVACIEDCFEETLDAVADRYPGSTWGWRFVKDHGTAIQNFWELET